MDAFRMLAVVGGLFGAAGVALAALAAHAGGDMLATASNFLLMHAPALLAIGLLARGSRPMAFAGVALALGVALFSGDLAAREFLGDRLFPMAAPAGGTLTIVAWLGVSVAALIARSRA